MKDNPAFTVNLPFDMATFKAAIDSFASAVDAALDGSKTAIADRNRQREVVIKMLRQLAHYVEAASKDDMSLLLSSGFEVRPTGRTKSPPVVAVHPEDRCRRQLGSTARIGCAFSGSPQL